MMFSGILAKKFIHCIMFMALGSAIMGMPGTVYVIHVWFNEPDCLACITSLNLHLWLIILFMKLLFPYRIYSQAKTIDVSL